jgi:hypothetical protein
MCRVLAYVPSHQWLFVSQPTDNNVPSGYGIKKVQNQILTFRIYFPIRSILQTMFIHRNI